VTIDPHLEGRQPTKWARPLKTYDRYEMMPVDAIPDANTVGFNLARHAVFLLYYFGCNIEQRRWLSKHRILGLVQA
jgi:hypothetical protein